MTETFTRLRESLERVEITGAVMGSMALFSLQVKFKEDGISGSTLPIHPTSGKKKTDLLLCFETGSHYLPQVGFELARWPRLAWNA